MEKLEAEKKIVETQTAGGMLSRVSSAKKTLITGAAPEV
jgi:hypothetical protein